MGKYTVLQTDVFSIFASTTWKAENLKTYPTDTIAINSGSEFLRVNIIAGGEGVNLKSVSGVLIIDIFVSAGNGPGRANSIADVLDTYLVGKSFKLAKPITTQFMGSSMVFVGRDPDNAALSMYSYSIPFNYFGV
jgi:hypothetical protein